MLRREFLAVPAALAAARAGGAGSSLDPLGRIHIPIGLPNTLDTLKTFVEAEGSFSPGVGTYGIYFWLFDTAAGRLAASTMPDIPCRHGLSGSGLLLPWVEWSTRELRLREEIGQARLPSPAGDVLVVAVQVRLTNLTSEARKIRLYAALRPLGAAGWDVKRLWLSGGGEALLVDDRPALVALQRPDGGGVVPTDTIGEFALTGDLPSMRETHSVTGDCSGALVFDLDLPPGRSQAVSLVCPVLAGRRAARHEWKDLKQNAMVDVAELNSADAGVPQPDAGLAFYSRLRYPEVASRAREYWEKFPGKFSVEVPDQRWGPALRAMLSHAALTMNEGAPDVAVVNYNVFNRDGVYMANIFQKSGLFALAQQALDYFLLHPFNGRAYPEADNPGQILWCLGEHWRFSGNRLWLSRIYPKAAQIASMIEYYRSTPGPHWVQRDGLAFGDALPAERREELKPGRCDGYHPEYTDAFDIAGLRATALLSEASGAPEAAKRWRELAGELHQEYDHRFGARLGEQYGSYCVLWPCRLYPLTSGKAWEQFRGVGAQRPSSWRYFPLASAHQGLLAGNREAAAETIAIHLDHPQMQGWYAFDEGGGSGSGGWHRVRTTWPHSKEKPGENLAVAMPHGWAIAEMWLLMRDSLLFEDGDRLVLFGGIPEVWLRDAKGIVLTGFRTYFGELSVRYQVRGNRAVLRLSGGVRPPGGILLRLPASQRLSAAVRGKTLLPATPGEYLLPPSAAEVTLRFAD